ncbi:THAP domain-containing protein, partial [Ooceraea biroi]
LSENTPRKQFLRTALKNTRLQLGKKIKVLQQKQRRTMKRVARLKDILTSLKNNNLLHREQLDMLKSLGCNLKTKSLQTYFCYPTTNEKVMVFLDPCHSLKLLQAIINRSTPKSRVLDDSYHEDKDKDEDLFPLPDIVTLSEFATRVIAYIAGFVVRHLEKVLHCETCIDALTGKETHIECSLINMKNRGGLTLPSHDVIVVCKKVEMVLRLALRESGDKYLLRKFTETYLVNQVLQHFIGNEHIFLNLREHSHDQTALNNHSFHLMRAIAFKYIKIRLYFI